MCVYMYSLLLLNYKFFPFIHQLARYKTIHKPSYQHVFHSDTFQGVLSTDNEVVVVKLWKLPQAFQQKGSNIFLVFLFPLLEGTNFTSKSVMFGHGIESLQARRIGGLLVSYVPMMFLYITSEIISADVWLWHFSLRQ